LENQVFKINVRKEVKVSFNDSVKFQGKIEFSSEKLSDIKTFMFSNNIRLTFINESGNVYKQQKRKIFHTQHPLESEDLR
jgi:hypothetical protein